MSSTSAINYSFPPKASFTQVDNENLTQTFASSFDKITPSVKNAFFENSKVYITTSESNEDRTIQILKEMGAVGNVFFGTSGFATLNLASVRKDVDYIVIIDPSNLTQLFWEKINTLIADSTSREECLIGIQKHILQSIKDYNSKDRNAEYHYCQALTQPSSWLTDDVRFKKIEEIFKNKRFVFLKADLTDTAVCQSIHKIFEEFKLQVDTIYLSNIHDYIAPKNYRNYQKSLECLLSKNTIVVDTEDQNFKITKALAKIYSQFTLKTCIMFPYFYRKVSIEDVIPSQRVRQRNEQSIETLYPIMDLACRFQPEELFYQYGLYKGFFENGDMENVSKKVDETLSSSLKNGQPINRQLIEQATANVLYPN